MSYMTGVAATNKRKLAAPNTIETETDQRVRDQIAQPSIPGVDPKKAQAPKSSAAGGYNAQSEANAAASGKVTNPAALLPAQSSQARSSLPQPTTFEQQAAQANAARAGGFANFNQGLTPQLAGVPAGLMGGAGFVPPPIVGQLNNSVGAVTTSPDGTPAITLPGSATPVSVKRLPSNFTQILPSVIPGSTSTPDPANPGQSTVNTPVGGSTTVPTAPGTTTPQPTADELRAKQGGVSDADKTRILGEVDKNSGEEVRLIKRELAEVRERLRQQAANALAKRGVGSATGIAAAYYRTIDKNVAEQLAQRVAQVQMEANRQKLQYEQEFRDANLRAEQLEIQRQENYRNFVNSRPPSTLERVGSGLLNAGLSFATKGVSNYFDQTGLFEPDARTPRASRPSLGDRLGGMDPYYDENALLNARLRLNGMGGFGGGYL